jgi:hypothetical protein
VKTPLRLSSQRCNHWRGGWSISGRVLQTPVWCPQDRVADIAACYEAAQRRVPSRAPASAIVYTLKRDTADEVAAALTRKGAYHPRVAQKIVYTHPEVGRGRRGGGGAHPQRCWLHAGLVNIAHIGLVPVQIAVASGGSAASGPHVHPLVHTGSWRLLEAV